MPAVGGSTGTTTHLPEGTTGSTPPSDVPAGPGVDDSKFDLSTADAPGAPEYCRVGEGLDALGECDTRAPPDSFEPLVQWAWTGPDNGRFSGVTPLVANLTDDNADGSIDLCDVPDVVVVAGSRAALQNSGGAPGRIFVLDGATGAVHFSIETEVGIGTTPALGDIDGDGLVEIVTTTPDNHHLIAFDHDGLTRWIGPYFEDGLAHTSVALADLEHDGNVEIIAQRLVFDATGTLLWTAPTQLDRATNATVVADIDGDGNGDVITGAGAADHTGALLFENTDVSDGRFAQVANLDGDLFPEILVTGAGGLSVLEHDGSTKYANLRPTGVSAGEWSRPAAIHDFDGDGVLEYAMSSRDFFTAYEADGTISWSAVVADDTGSAAGTAFDFLGDGTAEAMYADEESLYVFGATGASLMSQPRTSRTWIEYPVVADVDNDGSAEIVIVSNISLHGQRETPTVQVIRDAEDRWVPARRIWNQHTYHVTNIREDGTIPVVEPDSWGIVGTYRTQAQLTSNGTLCSPEL